MRRHFRLQLSGPAIESVMMSAEDMCDLRPRAPEKTIPQTELIASIAEYIDEHTFSFDDECAVLIPAALMIARSVDEFGEHTLARRVFRPWLFSHHANRRYVAAWIEHEVPGSLGADHVLHALQNETDENVVRVVKSIREREKMSA